MFLRNVDIYQNTRCHTPDVSNVHRHSRRPSDFKHTLQLLTEISIPHCTVRKPTTTAVHKKPQTFIRHDAHIFKHVHLLFKHGNDMRYSDGGRLACSHKLLPSSRSKITHLRHCCIRHELQYTCGNTCGIHSQCLFHLHCNRTFVWKGV